MGKSSKRKNKSSKLLQRDKALQLKRINRYESTAAMLGEEHFKLDLEGRLRDCYKVDLKLIQDMKNIRQDYVAINRDQLLDENFLSMLWQSVLSQMRAQEYSNALELCKEATNVKDNPMRTFYLSCIDLFLLRIEGFSSARVDRISKQVYELVKIKNGVELGSRFPIYLVFIDRALGELNKLRQFDIVRYLSSTMIKHNNKFVISLGQVFTRYSCVDNFRSAIINGNIRQVDLRIVNEIMNGSQFTIEYDEAGVGHLALSLILFYMKVGLYMSVLGDTVLNDIISDQPSNAMLESLKFALEPLQEYLAIKTERSTWKCCLCEEKKSSENELLICQGCRVVSYCCIDCQRSNYLYSEQTRTRGLGHKHLCPVFKAFRKLENNEVASMNDLLDRKFQRKCYRFFLSTLDTFKEESEM